VLIAPLAINFIAPAHPENPFILARVIAGIRDASGPNRGPTARSPVAETVELVSVTRPVAVIRRTTRI